MSKSVITRLFLGGVVAFVAGILLAVLAFIVGVSGSVFTFDGEDVTGVVWNGSAWAMVLLGLVGVLAIIGGALAGLVSWVGALVNTAQLPDKTWFILLLVLGLLSFGFVAMIAYVLAGPDGTVRAPAFSPAAPQTPAAGGRPEAAAS
jgi:hypothetical protein